MQAAGMGTVASIASSQAHPPGEAVRALEALGRRYAAGIRVLTLIPTLVVGLAAGTDAIAPALWVAIAVLTVWSAVYVWLVRGHVRPGLPITDAVVLAAVGLSGAWIVPLSWAATGKSWLLPFMAFASVAYQYSCGRLLGISCGLVVSAAAGAGVILGLPHGATMSAVVTSAWSGAIGLLAAVLWGLVRRGGAAADAARADLERAQRRREVSAALRHDQHALSTALHDTAASTLLMVGLGDVPTDVTRLADRARHDLAVLDTDRQEAEGARNRVLDAAIADVVDRAPLTVVVSGVCPDPLPFHVVRALADAAGEALANAGKYSGQDEAELAVRSTTEGVIVTVVDRGAGFDLSQVPATRRGIRDSIEGRMVRAGGSARVESTLDQGTSVRLEWPDGRPAR